MVDFRRFWYENSKRNPLLSPRGTPLSTEEQQQQSNSNSSSSSSSKDDDLSMVATLSSYVPKLVVRRLYNSSIPIESPEIETYPGILIPIHINAISISLVPWFLISRLIYCTLLLPYYQSINNQYIACVMFADVSGFTALTEKLASTGLVGVEKLTTELNSYFDKLIGIINRHGGDIVKVFIVYPLRIYLSYPYLFLPFLSLSTMLLLKYISHIHYLSSYPYLHDILVCWGRRVSHLAHRFASRALGNDTVGLSMRESSSQRIERL